MTQHGNAAKAYGLRARAPQRLRNLEAAVSRDEQADPAAEAAVAAGLRPRGLTKAELLHFRGRNKEYLEARNRILVQWASDPVRVLDADACAGVCVAVCTAASALFTDRSEFTLCNCTMIASRRRGCPLLCCEEYVGNATAVVRDWPYLMWHNPTYTSHRNDHHR